MSGKNAATRRTAAVSPYMPAPVEPIAPQPAAAPQPAGAPQPEPPQRAAAPQQPTTTPRQPEAAQGQHGIAQGQPEARKRPPKLQFDTDEDTAGRIRAAWHYTPVDEKEPSFKLFLQTAVLAEVTRREQANNRGEKYSPFSQRLTTGPRVGS